jgi:hypothetical protein
MNEPTPTSNDLRAKLRQLLAIPERDRTDEEWDAIVAIEIELGPGKTLPLPKNQNGQPGQPGGQQRHSNKQGKGGGGHWKAGKKPKGPPAA